MLAIINSPIKLRRERLISSFSSLFRYNVKATGSHLKQAEELKAAWHWLKSDSNNLSEFNQTEFQSDRCERALEQNKGKMLVVVWSQVMLTEP